MATTYPSGTTTADSSGLNTILAVLAVVAVIGLIYFMMRGGTVDAPGPAERTGQAVDEAGRDVAGAVNPGR